MKERCEEYQVLISGYLDGELDKDGERRLEAHIQQCSVCRREYSAMKRLVIGTAAAFFVDPPPEEVWDTFLDRVYNRLERKFGWVVFILGAVALTVFGLILFITEPWGSALIKLLIAAPVIGLVILFISVLRQRLSVAKTDRYSRDVQR